MCLKRSEGFKILFSKQLGDESVLPCTAMRMKEGSNVKKKKKSMYWEQKYLLTEQWSYDFKSQWAKPSIAIWQ